MDSKSTSFLAELSEFTSDGEPSRIENSNGIRYFVNEFWTSRQRQANRIHEISYRACFKPQLPAFFIKRLTEPGDIVYDPFMGRGTTPIEAALHRRISYGNDTNPLSKALTEPRLNPPSQYEVLYRLEQIPFDAFKTFQNEDLLTFFHPQTLAQIEGLRNWFLDRDKSNNLDHVDRWIRMVAINRLTGHSPGFFSVYTMPPNQAVTVARQKIINKRRNQVPPLRDVRTIIAKKSRTLLSQEPPSCKNALLLTEQSHNTVQIPADSVALTITSPPFLDVVDYEGDNWMRCWFLGIDPKSVRISNHRNIREWQSFIAATLKELSRITRPRGFIAFEVGEVRKGMVRLEENVISAASGLPLDVLGVMVNQQEFTKTSNTWGVSNNNSGTNSNRIVLLLKQP